MSEGTERKKVIAGALGWRRIRFDIRISASRCHAEKCAISAQVLFGNAAISKSQILIFAVSVVLIIIWYRIRTRGLDSGTQELLEKP